MGHNTHVNILYVHSMSLLGSQGRRIAFHLQKNMNQSNVVAARTFSPIPSPSTFGPILRPPTYGPVPRPPTFGPIPRPPTYGPVPRPPPTFGPVPRVPNLCTPVPRPRTQPSIYTASDRKVGRTVDTELVSRHPAVFLPCFQPPPRFLLLTVSSRNSNRKQ